MVAPVTAPTPLVRDATEHDAEACARIYTPYVTDTVVTFETVAPSVAEMGARISTALRSHAWVVLEDAGQVVGYAYAGPYKSRAAYRWSCEVSVYVELGRRRTGGGRALYEGLFRRLTDRGYRRAVAGRARPKEAGEGLHRAGGFEPVGIYRRIGWKHGAGRDVARMQRALAIGEDPPAEPR